MSELVERVARVLCRAPGSLCVGFCHSKRCTQATSQYGDIARAVIPLIYNAAIEDAAANLATWFPPGTEGHPNFGAIASVRALAKP